LKQFVAARGSENGLYIVIRFFINLPNCLYIKKDCDFLQSYGKTREKPNFFDYFLMDIPLRRKGCFFIVKDDEKVLRFSLIFTIISYLCTQIAIL